MTAKIAVSTGEIDKRTLNGNNGTSRGSDKKTRKRPTGYYVLKDEVIATLAQRLENVIEYYGNHAEMVKRLGVSFSVIHEWKIRGRISADGAHKIHKDYQKNGCQGYRASYCRPDLRFDGNGKPLTRKCDKREMMRVVR